VQLLRWGRAAGWTRDPGRAPGWVSPDGSTTVEVDSAASEMGVYTLGVGRYAQWYPVSTIRQGIEQLVTLGLLPIEASPVYAEGRSVGWRAAQEWADAVAVQQGARLVDLARLLGRLQVAAWCAAEDDPTTLATVRATLDTAGYGNPFAELAQHTAGGAS
jgi:hypothetical protein